MNPTKRQQLEAISAHLSKRRDAILSIWSAVSHADPSQTRARSLTRSQFYDHIPQVLEAFEHRLRSWPGGVEARAAAREQKEEDIKHGLHRWQQGYELLELINEWGHLQMCIFEELQAYAADHPELNAETLAEVTRQMIFLVNSAISESTSQYARLQKAEAAGRLRDLEQALAEVRELEHRRATLFHQAVHDLRANVQSVRSAAEVLGEADIAQGKREEFASMLQQSVQSTGSMLGELMELARLEAGQERIGIAGFDASVLIRELCRINEPFARERNLYLEFDGDSNLWVEGDAPKVRRLLQNLLLNALKYTEVGGVTVSWGEHDSHWWATVKDTGPGLPAGPGAPVLAGLKAATASARESDENSVVEAGEESRVLRQPEADWMPARPRHQQAGEGIGISIVKRLCELLDASLEFASSPETGSMFRVVLPKKYKKGRDATA